MCELRTVTCAREKFASAPVQEGVVSTCRNVEKVGNQSGQAHLRGWRCTWVRKAPAPRKKREIETSGRRFRPGVLQFFGFKNVSVAGRSATAEGREGGAHGTPPRRSREARPADRSTRGTHVQHGHARSRFRAGLHLRTESQF